MRRPTLLLLMIALPLCRARGQQWSDGGSIDLIRRAVQQRTTRDADTLVTTWQAEAHGFLRYASVLDHGDGPVERVIKADELHVEVYGESPNRSKQIITAWRDTSFLPNHVVYHRDHLGIVANDFGATIRLGQGDEVRDVLHPLSESGVGRYQFSVGDTVLLHTPTGTIRVVAVRVRPASGDSAGTVGTLFIDLDRAALVRFQFTFTPASYRDHTVEDITVTLENSLLSNAKWLPWHQSIVIRRGEALLDLPVRTVIRGDWTIDNYQLAVHHPPDRFAGPFLVGPRTPIRGGVWPQPMAASMEGLPATDADVREVGDAASAALNGRSLDGLPIVRLLARGISDLIRVNRVEGVVTAIGTTLRIGDRWTVRGRIGFGFSDQRAIGALQLVHHTPGFEWSVLAERAVEDIGETPVISGVGNSLSTLAGGTDFGDYVRVDRVIPGVRLHTGSVRWSIGSGYERVTPAASTFAAGRSSIVPNPTLVGYEAAVSTVSVSAHDRYGFGWLVNAEEGVASASNWTRLSGEILAHKPLSGNDVVLRVEGGIAFANLPSSRSFTLGGRGTLLGVPFREMGGRRSLVGEVSFAIPVKIPAPKFPYSRYVTLGSTLSPYVAAGIAGGDIADAPWRATGQVQPVAGLRLDLWGPLFRIETGIALRTGRAALAIDIHPTWWPLM